MTAERTPPGRGLDPDKLAQYLRPRIIKGDEQQVLLARFYGTDQGHDVTSGITCGGYGRLHYYSRPSAHWSPVPIPELPAAWRLGLDPTQTRIAQLFQNAACDFRCWYCFVDRDSLAGKETVGEFMSAEQIVDLYVRDGIPSPVLALTGGQPDIIPEWTLWMMKALEKVKLSQKVYLWQDDNLSCGYTWTHLSDADREYMRAYRNYGRCCCLKSFTAEGFAETTGARAVFFDRQIELLQKLVAWGVDIYVYLTLTCSNLDNLRQKMSTFVDRLQREIHHNLPLRVVPLEIKVFTPTMGRLTALRQDALKHQFAALEAWQDEICRRFSSQERAVPIYLTSIQ
jgi:uncharacterized Fe-S cluster-containing radical SAM superfamily protein